jgi:hypothetical protein
MATEFDYTATDTPSDVVLSVADAIRADYRLAPLTDEQKLQRRIDQEIWREQQALASERRAFEYQERQAEAEAIARAEQAAEIAEANRKRTLERQEQIARQVQQREMADLRLKVQSHSGWQSGVQRAVRQNLADQYRNTLMGELDAMINPPPPQPTPEPEPQIVVEQPAEDTRRLPPLGYPKLRSWW